MGIWCSSGNTKKTDGRVTSTQPVLFVFRHSNSTTYDHWSHPEEPKTSIVSSNRIITLRFRCKWVFGVLLKIVIFLIWGLCWHRLFYLCQGIQFQLLMTRGATHRNLGHTLLLFLPGAYTRACWAWNRRSLRIAGEAPTTRLGRPLVGLSHMPILVMSLCCHCVVGPSYFNSMETLPYWWQCRGCYRFTLLLPSSRHPTNSQPCITCLT